MNTFKAIKFTVGSGGQPMGMKYAPESAQLVEAKFRYKTVANGLAYSWSWEVACAPTGRTKKFFGGFNAGEVTGVEYQMEDGTRFGWAWADGSPHHFDNAWFLSPDNWAEVAS